jgi:tetratricopeptide (TPR) repeat protein
MINITPTTPSFTFGYWRPWKENSNMFDSYLNYAKDVSLAKYGADTVGTYINQAAKEQVQAINNLGQAIGKGLNVLSRQMSDINDSLLFLNRNIDIQIEQQKLSNLLLQNIAELLRVPDSEKERQHCIELGIKFFVNGQKDPDLYSDALEELLKAEVLMKQDYFVLHRIGCIYLYVEKYINPEKALEYFSKAAKYASVESDSSAFRLANILNKNFETVNSHINNSEKQIGLLAADSYEKASFVAYILGRFDEAVSLQNKALKFNPSAENKFLLAKYQVRNSNIKEAIDNLSQSIDENPNMVSAAFKEIDLINEIEVVNLIAQKNDLINVKIRQLAQKLKTFESTQADKVLNELTELLNNPYELKIKNYRKFELEGITINSRITELEDKIDKYIIEVKQMIFCTFDELKIENIIQDLVKIKNLPFEKMHAEFHDFKKEIEGDKIQVGSKYAGGIVIYIEKNGTHGLVCSEADFGESVWGAAPVGDDKNKYTQFETSSVLGEGLNNSRLIAENANFKIIDSLFSSKKEFVLTAAELCLKSTHNGYNDWHLPNSAEMYEIVNMINKSLTKNLSMTPTLYWTSNSCGLQQAFAFDFSKKNIVSEITGRLKTCKVRGVRKF